VLRQAMGNNLDWQYAETLRQQWAIADFTTLPKIEILSGDALPHASGAYASQTDTIYLSSNLFNANSPDPIVAVLLEELGHALDYYLNSNDAPGDEGAFFSALVLGQQWTAGAIASSVALGTIP